MAYPYQLDPATNRPEMSHISTTTGQPGFAVYGGNYYAVFCNGGPANLAEAWRSTDQGLTWSRLDTSGSKTIAGGMYSAVFDPTRNRVWVAWSFFDGMDTVARFSYFDLATESWAIGISSDGPVLNGDFHLVMSIPDGGGDGDLWLIFEGAEDWVLASEGIIPEGYSEGYGGDRSWPRVWAVQISGGIWGSAFRLNDDVNDLEAFWLQGASSGTAGRMHVFFYTFDFTNFANRLRTRVLTAGSALKPWHTFVAPAAFGLEDDLAAAPWSASDRTKVGFAYIYLSDYTDTSTTSLHYNEAVSADSPSWTDETILTGATAYSFANLAVSGTFQNGTGSPSLVGQAGSFNPKYNYILKDGTWQSPVEFYDSTPGIGSTTFHVCLAQTLATGVAVIFDFRQVGVFHADAWYWQLDTTSVVTGQINGLARAQKTFGAQL